MRELQFLLSVNLHGGWGGIVAVIQTSFSTELGNGIASQLAKM